MQKSSSCDALRLAGFNSHSNILKSHDGNVNVIVDVGGVWHELEPMPMQECIVVWIFENAKDQIRC